MATNLPNYVVNMLSEVPKLTDSNFQTWKKGMTMFFSGCGASYLLSTPLPATVPNDSEAVDKKMVFFIWSRLSEELRYLVEGKTSGLEAWEAVSSHFQRSTMPRRLQAREAFYRIEHDPSKPISIYIHAVDSARQVLVDLGSNIDDTETLNVLLMNLHPDFHTVRTTILTAATEPTLANVKNILAGSAGSAITIKSESFDLAMAARGPWRVKKKHET